MAIPPKQIGYSEKANLLWEISRELDRLLSKTCTGPCPTTTSTTSSTTTITTTLFCPNCEQSTVDIGTQTWYTCNLDVTTYRNGDVIPMANDETEWLNYASLGVGAWCYYNFDSANGPIYGKLYSRSAVNDARGLAPIGQKIPSDSDWSTLSTFLGASAGGKMKQEGLCRWLSPNTGATNESGFTGLPGGGNFAGSFVELNNFGIWWSSTISLAVNTTLSLAYNDVLLTIGGAFDTEGFSVRCLVE